MKRLRALWLIPWLLLAVSSAPAAPTGEFDLYRLEADDQGPVVLVLGGIQGDEPGGFHAAALLATRYRVESGRLWVAPNLSPHAILERHRGPHGDLNRKFARLPVDDPEFALVQRIKALIESPEVALVINLHDGSGFYRPVRRDRLHGPARWGQSLVIDGRDFTVSDAKGARVSLGEFADRVVHRANPGMPPDWALAVKDTRTADGDIEMQQTLTWYAVGLGKPAMAGEASKSLNLAQRVFTHLRLVEAALEEFGVGFRRDFELRAQDLEAVMSRDLRVRLDAGRLCLPLDGLKSRLAGIPLAGEPGRGFAASNPLLALREVSGGLELRFGNRRLAVLQTTTLAVADPVDLQVQIDDRVQLVQPCAILPLAGRSLRLRVPEGYRVNAIGAGGRDDQERDLALADFDPGYALDRAGRRYRAEIYRDHAYAGSVILDFGAPVQTGSR